MTHSQTKDVVARLRSRRKEEAECIRTHPATIGHGFVAMYEHTVRTAYKQQPQKPRSQGYTSETRTQQVHNGQTCDKLSERNHCSLMNLWLWLILRLCLGI